MGKSDVKKFLLSMGKDEIIKMVLELYSARKEAKDYLDYFSQPNEKGKLEEYKKIVREEFYPSKTTRDPKTRFSVCRKAVADFKKLHLAPEYLADLMLYVAENACEFTYDYGDMWEQFYTSAENNYAAALKFIVANGLFPQFEKRAEQCTEWAKDCGWGFEDSICDMFEDAKIQHEELKRSIPRYTTKRSLIS